MSPAQLHLELELAELRKQQYLKEVGIDADAHAPPENGIAAMDSLVQDASRLQGQPPAITYPQEPQAPDKVYLTDIQDNWSDAISNDFRQTRRNVEVNMHEIELPKYNEKIKMLEKLRQEALNDIHSMENELGIQDSSVLDSVDLKE